MNHTLSDVEIRVLGSLVEKEITTPDYYPLSLNALVAACNQSSNRNPVTHFDEETVARAADTLRERKLVHLVDRFESRVSKYRHVLYETMNLGRPAIAVMCVLMGNNSEFPDLQRAFTRRPAAPAGRPERSPLRPPAFR